MHTIIKRNQKQLERICRKYQVDLEEAIGRNRKREFIKARCEIACLLKYKYKYTYESIGDAMDGRNHAAIMYLVKKCVPKKQFGGKAYFKI